MASESEIARPVGARPEGAGRFEARYLAFIETTLELRPQLHRYCARMTGSVMDGEDVVQEALFEAYRKLEKFDDTRALKPWLFRIAHNRCIDFLRRRGVRLEADTMAAEPEQVAAAVPPVLGLGRALEHLVLSLPPMERACVLLKDVFDHSLEEIAALVDSTEGGVKAALHRGRAKLKAAPTRAPRPLPTAGKGDTELRKVIELYVERFNRRDWPALRELIRDDATLSLPGRYAGRVLESPYFSRYEAQAVPCRCAVGELDGEPVVIVWERMRDGEAGESMIYDGARWRARTPVRIALVEGRIARITDYYFCTWILDTNGEVGGEAI